MQRDLTTGEIIDFRETFIESAGANPKNSMSLSRAPAPPSEATRGNSLYVPFWPGSFPAVDRNVSKNKETGLGTGRRFIYLFLVTHYIQLLFKTRLLLISTIYFIFKS